MPNQLSILSDYEFGRAMTAIEWVALGDKPIVDAGGHVVDAAGRNHLADDLNHCLDVSRRENVHGYIMRDRTGWWAYGFYRYGWALEALLFLQGKSPRIQ